jgi:hypothetical protein
VQLIALVLFASGLVTRVVPRLQLLTRAKRPAICFQLAHLGHVDRHSNPLYMLKKIVLDLDGSPKDALGEPWRAPLSGATQAYLVPRKNDHARCWRRPVQGPPAGLMKAS